jgi:hypothetical protein
MFGVRVFRTVPFAYLQSLQNSYPESEVCRQLCTVFVLVWLNDRSRGGYQIESIDEAPGEQ